MLSFNYSAERPNGPPSKRRQKKRNSDNQTIEESEVNHDEDSQTTFIKEHFSREALKENNHETK